MRSQRPLVAVVDDEESVRRALARLLRAREMEVETFASGSSFLRSLGERGPDCLVLDLQMPGLTGRDVQKRLLASRRAIPVIFVTAHNEPVLREQCMADGAYAYLEKPLRSELLVTCILSAIDGARHAP